MQIASITPSRGHITKGITYTAVVETAQTERSTTGTALATYVTLTDKDGNRKRLYITAGEFQTLKQIFEPVDTRGMMAPQQAG